MAVMTDTHTHNTHNDYSNYINLVSIENQRLIDYSICQDI